MKQKQAHVVKEWLYIPLTVMNLHMILGSNTQESTVFFIWLKLQDRHVIRIHFSYYFSVSFHYINQILIAQTH